MRQLKISKSITNRDSASLERFLSDISKVQMIGADEEVELARKIKAGDEDALNKLVTTNLRFVVSVAKQYQNQGIGLQDLINEGNLGLIKAAQRFDETRGFKFISYAVWWIRQAILQAIADQSRIVRLPLNRVGVINKIIRVDTVSPLVKPLKFQMPLRKLVKLRKRISSNFTLLKAPPFLTKSLVNTVLVACY